MDAASITAISLLTLGVLFVLTELLFGSDGSFLLFAGLCLTVGIVCAANAWWLPGHVAWWAYPLIVVIVVPMLVYVGVLLFPRTPVGQDIMAEPEEDEIAPIVDDSAGRLKWMGMVGQTVTMMNPGGLIQLNGERLHAETMGFMLSPGVEVEVVDVKASRLVVKPVDEAVS